MKKIIYNINAPGFIHHSPFTVLIRIGLFWHIFPFSIQFFFCQTRSNKMTRKSKWNENNKTHKTWKINKMKISMFTLMSVHCTVYNVQVLPHYCIQQSVLCKRSLVAFDFSMLCVRCGKSVCLAYKIKRKTSAISSIYDVYAEVSLYQCRIVWNSWKIKHLFMNFFFDVFQCFINEFV